MKEGAGPAPGSSSVDVGDADACFATLGVDHPQHAVMTCLAQGRRDSWSLDGTFNASIGVKLEGADDWLNAQFEA